MNEEKSNYIENQCTGEIIPEKLLNEIKYAPVWARFTAGIIDHSICLLIFLSILFTFFNSYISLIFFSSIYFGSAFFVMTFIIEIYYLSFEKLCNGQTLGKMFMDLEVVSDSNKLFFRNVFIRNFLRCFYLLPPFFIIPDLIIILINRKHKRFGDLIANTVVVKKYIG